MHLAGTDRSGGGAGRSVGPWAGLNLGPHVGDDPAAVEANVAAVAAAAGLAPDRLLRVRQVHGADVVHATGPWPGEPPEADAVVTDRADLGLLVMVADCVPVLLAAPDEGLLGVAHAGRPGLRAGVVPATVAAMRDLGATRLEARLGPSVCPRCYPVPAAMRDDVAAIAPASRSVSWTGEPALDVGAGVLEQATAAGVQVRQRPGCTVESPDLYSLPARRRHRPVRRSGLAHHVTGPDDGPDHADPRAVERARAWTPSRSGCALRAPPRGASAPTSG
nr:polyphenol oxidase family protein [Angustibacter aerolatus]